MLLTPLPASVARLPGIDVDSPYGFPHIGRIGLDAVCVLDDIGGFCVRTRVSLTALGILASAFAVGGAHAADCRSPRVAAEVEVCRDRALSALDGQMQQAYAAALGRTDEKGRLALQHQQSVWERDRDGCGNQPACLRAVYAQRIDELGRFR